jgi:acyl-CoA thioesterase I
VSAWTREQLAYLMAYLHPEKMLGDFPGVGDVPLHSLFGIDEATYTALWQGFAQRARGAAQQLLADPAFARNIDRLPFSAGQTVVGFGDSITDDYQSWLEILRQLLDLRRSKDGIAVINAGYSGDTTSQMLSRFLGVVRQKPDWIICMAGTNDARAHGKQPVKTMVSIEETAANLAALRHFAARETAAYWVWLTPTPVIEHKIAAHWHLGGGEMAWSNHDLRAVADLVRRQPDPVVDLQAAFGDPADPDLLLSDGLHPSLAGQTVIVKALVEQLTRHVVS